MRITIAKPFAPFSQEFGVKLPLLRTRWVLRVYPTKWILSNGKKQTEIQFSLHGPFQNFLVMLNLEKERIEVSGKAQEGFFRFYLLSKNQIQLVTKKAPSSCKITLSGTSLEAINVEKIDPFVEKLSLGVHKTQDITMIRRRDALEEILPLWHRVAGFYPATHVSTLPVQADVEAGPETSPKTGPKTGLEAGIEQLYKTFHGEFSGIFCPEKDPYYQRIEGSISSPLDYGPNLIRQLFFSEHGEDLHVLKKVFFPFGKMQGIQTALGSVDFSWAKKKLRELVLQVEKAGKLKIKTAPSIKYCRVFKNRSCIHKKMPLTMSMPAEAGCTYTFDRFAK